MGPVDTTPEKRVLELTETSRVPWDGALLGWGAMLPLALCAGAAWMGHAETVEMSRAAARLWGAALLLFFSGVRRGLSFRTEGGPAPAQMVVFALLFVAGLADLLIPVSWALGLLTLAFVLLAILDAQAARRGEAPLYFVRLRPLQMGFAAVATGLCWAAR